MTGIYKITNKLTNDCYIGLSVDIEKRWQRHKWAYKQPKNNTHLYLAMRKYGIENFNFEVIEQCHKEELQDREIYWINYYDSYNHGYNMTPGGEYSSLRSISAVFATPSGAETSRLRVF